MKIKPKMKIKVKMKMKMGWKPKPKMKTRPRSVPEAPRIVFEKFMGKVSRNGRKTSPAMS